jgi:hypothetical protein
MSTLPETISSQPQTQEVNQNNEPSENVKKVSPVTPEEKQNENKEPSVNNENSVAGQESVTDELSEAILRMEEQLRFFMRSQRFIEAEELKNKIKELKLEVVIKKSKEIELRHAEELNQIERAQCAELDLFNDQWNIKVIQYREEAELAEKEMIVKHEADLGALEKDLIASLPLFVRTSPKILNVKKMIDTLAKQKEFVQADKLKAQLAMLEEEEFRKSEDQKEKKVIHILMQLASKQKNELAGLKKRAATGYAELLKARDGEYQKLRHKLQNVVKSIEITQQLEFSKFEMAYKNYVPGERLRFKSRQRKLESNLLNITSAKNNTSYSNGLNNSFAGDLRSGSAPQDLKKRSATPVKKGYHVRGHNSSNTNNGQNQLIPINPNRFVTPQKERKGSLLQGVN